MAQNFNPTFVKTPNYGTVQITTGTGSSGLVTVYSGGTNGSKVTALIATATTTSEFDLQWGVTTSATFTLFGTVSIPAGAGSSNGVATVSLIGANMPGLTIDSDGNPFFFLASSAYSIQAKTPATSSTWTAGTVMNIIAPSVGDF